MIIKSKQSSNYTVLPNEIFNTLDDALAIGVLAFLLSKSKEWITYKQHLYSHFKQGRKAIDSAFEVLQEAGYVIGVQKVGDNGQFNGFEWVVYDKPFNGEPENTPVVPLPAIGLPAIGKEATTKVKNIPSKEIIKNTKKELNISFIEFWNLYDKKVGKPKCLKKWTNLTNQERELIIAYIPLYKKSQPNVKYRKNPETFLNNRAWEDKLYDNEGKPFKPENNLITPPPGVEIKYNAHVNKHYFVENGKIIFCKGKI